jgi:DNA polymerase-3 subunit epsilon
VLHRVQATLEAESFVLGLRLPELGRWIETSEALPVSASPPEPVSPWQQPDLMGLIAGDAKTATGGSEMAAATSPPEPDRAQMPAAPASAAPLQLSQASQQHERKRCPPSLLLIVDTETTALVPQQGQCIEVGAILFSVPHRTSLQQVSFLLPAQANPAVHVNGIPAEMTQVPQPWQAGLACFGAMVGMADALLAHNAAFDRQWFGIDPLPTVNKPWICSMEDISWPAERHLRPNPSVRDLALAYGVPVWAAHRALTDCIYLAQVFERCDNLETLLQAAIEPRHLFRACLSYAERHLAKQAGFRWNEPVPKAWSRRLTEQEAAALPFPVQAVEPDVGEDASAA